MVTVAESQAQHPAVNFTARPGTRAVPPTPNLRYDAPRHTNNQHARAEAGAVHHAVDAQRRARRRARTGPSG
jgi:hypothetical protein